MADDKLKRRLTRQSKASEKAIELFIANLDKFLNKNLRRSLENVLTGKTSRLETASILGSLKTELEKLGLGEQIAKLRDVFVDELQFVVDEFGEQGIRAAFADTDAAIVNALIDNNLKLVTTEIDRYGVDIQSKVMQSVLTSKQPTFDELEGKLTPKLRANLNTELNTAIMAFNRTVTVKKAQDIGFDLFLYIGPDDKITREFCHGLLSKTPPIYSIDEINAMDNEQGINVFTGGGGYNCRHHWRPVTLARAKELGYRD